MNLPLPPNFAFWEAVLIGAALPIFWCLIIAFASVLGGWYRLSKLYPADQTRFGIAGENDGRRFSWTTLVMGPPLFPTNYGNCVNVVVNEWGIRVDVALLFRTLHPPFLIPWSAVENCRLDRQLAIFTRATVEVAGVPYPLRFYGRAARAIECQWTERCAMH
jgi:hypothetical protein